MDFWNYATDVRLFIAAGIVLALCIGSVGDSVATLSIGVLILQMTASIHGMHIGKDEFHSDIKPAFISLVCCFGICTGSALLMGLLFMNDTSLWYGWVMLSAVPAGVSVVTLSLIMKGNMGMTMISMVLVYACALAITPLMTYLFIGDAISPLEILKYIVLFIGIPVLLNIPLGKVSIQRKYKVTFINFMMMLLVVLALGNNRDFILAHLDMVGLILAACVFRTFVVGSLILYILRRKGIRRDNTVVYTGYAVWKNSGLAASLCMILLVAYPTAALPCAVSLVTESVWFALTSKAVATHWPSEVYPSETRVFSAEKH